MPDVLVLGGGIAGLATAMLLARDGHDVTVIESDPQGAPRSADEAWEEWQRKGVAQFRQPHNMHTRFRLELDNNLPDIRERLGAAGGCSFDPISAMPATLADRSSRPDDERLRAITGRRPFLEDVFARAADAEPRVTVERGRKVTGLVAGTSLADGVLHVTGVRTDDGRELTADLVVDAMGRRSKSPDWIEQAGGRRPIEEAEDCGFVYYTRYFRSPGGRLPEYRTRMLVAMGTFSTVCLPGDNGTHSVTLFTSTGDAPLKRLRFVDTWTKVVAACPYQAHWLEGEPMSDIEAMSGIADRYRHFSIDGTPCVTGLLAVADAHACTNPSLGRGLSLGMMHAGRLRDAYREHSGDPLELARAWAAITEAELRPWYDTQIQMDRARWAEIEALREGRDPPPPAPQSRAFNVAASLDPDVFRASMEIVSCITLPHEVFARPDIAAKVQALAGEELPTPPGPDRAELLELVS